MFPPFPWEKTSGSFFFFFTKIKNRIQFKVMLFRGETKCSDKLNESIKSYCRYLIHGAERSQKIGR